MGNKWPLFFAACLLAVWAGNEAFSADQAASAGSSAPPRTEMILEPYVGTLKTVTIAVGGQVLPFILDTGGGFTTVTPEVARTIACVPFGRLTGFRHSGERIDTLRCGTTTLQLGSVKIDLQPAVFDLMGVLRKFGDLPVVGGLLALNAFENSPVTLDFAHGKLIIESEASLKQRVEGMKPLSIRLARQAGGAALDLFVQVAARTGDLWLELDSGNSGPVILSRHAVTQLGLDAEKKTVSVNLDIVGLGPLKCEAVVADTIYDGLLNIGFMNDVVLTIDLGSRRAWAKKHEPLNESK